MLLETSKMVRGRMLDEGVAKFVNNLNFACNRTSPDGQQQDRAASIEHWAVDGLRHFTARTAFNAIFTTVFGRKDDHVFNSEMVFNNFETFHKYECFSLKVYNPKFVSSVLI